MRWFRFLLLAVGVALGLPSIAAAAPTTSIELKAEHVYYYSNRFILTADGNVRAQLSDGTLITGDTFSVDLKLNRFLIAGQVHVVGRGLDLRAAAIAGFPDLDRTYVLTLGPHPDRWTYFGDDYSQNHAGREQPGDAYIFPDLSAEKPYIIAKSATLFLKNNVAFPPGARIYVLGVYTPTPGYVVNYSSNPNFYQNAYSGAIFNAPIPYHGVADAISEFDLRGDSYRGIYTSFQQHFVHNLDYAVFSVNPLTQNERQWNAILYKRISPAVEVRYFAQLSTLSVFLGGPSQSSSYQNLEVNWRLGKYAWSTNMDQYNNDLLGNPPNEIGANGLNSAAHPFDGQITVQSFEDSIKMFTRLGVPLKFQYRAGFGEIHDNTGISQINGTNEWGGVVYNTIWQHFVGATLYTSPVRVAPQTSLSAKFDDQIQWYSLGHHVVTQNFNTTLAYTPTTNKLPAAYLAYNITNVGDYYGALQLTAYPAFEGNVPGQPGTYTNLYGTFTGLDAFRGLATSRNLTIGVVYAPNPNFALNFITQRYYNTPVGIPGLGGQPPWEFTPDIRIRLARNLLVDVSNSYYFNWAGARWNATTNVVISQ